MEGRSTLTVKEVNKSFKGLKAVDDVSFSVQTGEILGLIGPNGSGKTTTVNIVTGMLPKDSGRIEIDGRNIGDLPAHKVASCGLVRTYQKIRLFKNMSNLENVMVGAIGVGMKRREAAEFSASLLMELGLEDKINASAAGMTFRDQRLVELARALAAKPKFVMLDEPAAGLNESETDELFSLLKAMPEKKHIGMLIIEHDMRLIMNLCDRLHVLNYGRTIAEGTPEEVRKNPEVIQAYLGSTAS